MRLARPMPPTPMPAMLSMSLGGTKPRPRTWRGTIVNAAAVTEGCERNLRRGIALFSVMGSSLAAKRVTRGHGKGAAAERATNGTCEVSGALLRFAEELRGDEPDELAVWRGNTLQLDEGDSGFLHRGDMALRADGCGQQAINVRRVAKAEYR